MKTLVVVVSGFVVGIFFESLINSGWWSLSFCLFIAALFSAAYFLQPYPFFLYGVFFFICLSAGMFRMALAETPLPKSFLSHVGERVQYEAVVVSDPDVREHNQRVILDISYEGEKTRMLAVAKKDTVVAVGDSVWVSGTLAIPQPFDTEGGRVFHYDKYLEKDGVRFLLNFAYVRIKKAAPAYSAPAALSRIKHVFLDSLSAALPNPYAALAGGIVIGGKTGLGTELHDAFVKSGLVQIIVLSGYNVMIVATWIMSVLSLARLSRQWVTFGGAAALTLFVGVAGFSATAVRAMCMALIALYARATGRSYNAGRALFVAVLIMLVWNPYYLLFDPGFGLSVAATAGIIWLTPLVARKCSWIRSHFWNEIVATTIAAQMAVLPLLLYTMGIFSIVALPVNILVSPLVPFTMGWSVVAGVSSIVCGSFAPALTLLLASPTHLLTWLIITIATTSSSLSFSTLVLPAFPFWVMLLVYALFIYRAYTVSKRFSTTDQFTFARNASM